MYSQDILFPNRSYVMTIDITRWGKLDPIYKEPFKVMRRTRGRSYILQDNDSTLLFRNYSLSALKLILQNPILASKSYEV